MPHDFMAGSDTTKLAVARMSHVSSLDATNSSLADLFQEFGEIDTGDPCRLWQQAGRGHAGQRIRLQAPESAMDVAAKVDPAVSP